MHTYTEIIELHDYFRNHWGWVIDVINSASHSLNFTYTIQNPNPPKFGYNKDGSYRGPVGIAMNRVVDFSIGCFPIESANSKVTTFFINIFIFKQSDLIFHA